MKAEDLIIDGRKITEWIGKHLSQKINREAVLEKLIRCSLRAFKKHLNTPETRIIRRAAKRLGIEVENVNKK